MGVRVRTVQRWENGLNEPGVTVLGRWADVTGVTAAWLLGAVEGDEPQFTGRSLEALREQWRRNEELLRRIAESGDDAASGS